MLDAWRKDTDRNRPTIHLFAAAFASAVLSTHEPSICENITFKTVTDAGSRSRRSPDDLWADNVKDYLHDGRYYPWALCCCCFCFSAFCVVTGTSCAMSHTRS